MKVALTIFASIVFLWVPRSTAAQTIGTDPEARGLFLAGQAAFEAARYQDALGYFRRAHELSNRPELLYNIGITADRLRQDEQALAAFERFLVEAPDSVPQRADVEARVAILRASLASRPSESSEEIARSESPPVTPTPGTLSPTDSRWTPTGPIVVLALSGAMIAGGGAFYGVSRSEAATVENAPAGTPWRDVAGSADNASWMSSVGIALMATGTAAAVAGILWWTLADKDSPDQVQALIGPGSLAIAGKF